MFLFNQQNSDFKTFIKNCEVGTKRKFKSFNFAMEVSTITIGIK